MKKFAAFARVSSREQQREGFSLEVQEIALKRYATDNGGEIVKFTTVAETASDDTARRHFNEIVGYAIQNAAMLDGILFYKVDRAIRNTPDLCKLEELEHRHGVLVEFTSQPFPHTPAGWLNVRNLANMATRKSVTSRLPTQLIEYDAMYSPPPRTAVMPSMIAGIQRIITSSLCTKVPSSSGFINAGSATSVSATITIPSKDRLNISR